MQRVCRRLHSHGRFQPFCGRQFDLQWLDLYGTIKRVYSVQGGKEVNHWTFKHPDEEYFHPELTLEEEIAMMEMFENDDWWVMPMKDLAIWFYFIACGLFTFIGLVSCGILDISIIIQRLRGGRYELWYVDFPVCDTIWHYTTTPNKPPNGICRGSVIRVREYKGVWPFRRNVEGQR